jgi:hypothetical protein
MKSSHRTLCALAGALVLGLSSPAAFAQGASVASAARLVVKGKALQNGKGETVRLRGFGLGGMLHLENFIDGYPGNEEAFRDVLLKAMGREKYDLFFETFYENYFTEADARYIASLGLNLVRIPIHYRLFEDDMNPRVIRASGFKHLDRVVKLCAAQGIYTIIDLHARPAPRTSTGTATTRRTAPCSGSTRTSRTAPSCCGRRSRATTGTSRGSRATT